MLRLKEMEVNYSSWKITAAVTAILVSLKLLLIPAYLSTDFEVHRNWMALTANLPLSRWYFDTTSKWTLDYPPFFAYFEKLVSVIAIFTDYKDILELQEAPLLNRRVIYFQRISVIVTDIFFIAVCSTICFSETKRFSNLPKKIGPSARVAAFVLLSSNVGLLMVDSIHFQYNSMLTIFLLLSVYFADNYNYLVSAFFYCVLINFKHIYLYYAPAFVIFYIRHYFILHQKVKGRVFSVLRSGLLLTGAMGVPFILSLTPFIATGGISTVRQIISRLFPVSRGLTHAYWAPNIWAMYNAFDLLLYRFCIGLKLDGFSAPTYTSGLVQEYNHSVLPTITPGISVACIIISLLPLFFILLKRTDLDICVYLVLSSLSFFLFGYHVHEKALLVILMPLLLLALTDPRFIPVTALLSTITTFSLFPILFTTFEIPLKYSLGISYFLLIILMFRFAFGVRPNFIFSNSSIFYIIGLFGVEIYSTFIHQALFGNRFTFFPLLLISVYNSIGVISSYIWILFLTFEDDLFLSYKKTRCEFIETMIKAGHYSVQTVESIEEVQIVGGIDISTSKFNSNFAVVAFSLFNYPSLDHLATFDDIIVITEPYISNYLAIRESRPVASFVKRILSENPHLRPDIIICDGNGRFHPRGCGLASHIGALTGIATIGVAKNLNLSILKSLNADDNIINNGFELINRVSKENSDGFAPFDVVLPVCMNVARLGGSKVPVYISSGFGIDLNLATEIVLNTATNRICKPIRQADLHSREKVREYFDGK